MKNNSLVSSSCEAVVGVEWCRVDVTPNSKGGVSCPAVGYPGYLGMNL